MSDEFEKFWLTTFNQNRVFRLTKDDARKVWAASESALAPMREALQALVETYGNYSRATEFVEAMAKAERLVKGKQ